MDNKLILEIANLGPINRADLEIGKINVVVGKNSTGKSTSSKFLFCLLTAISKEGIDLANRDIKNRLSDIFYLLKFKFFDIELMEDINLNYIEDLLIKPSSNNLFDEIYRNLNDLSKKIILSNSKDIYINKLKKVHNLIKINKNRDLQYVHIFNSLLDSEYAYSIESYKDTHINFKYILNNKTFSQEVYIKKGHRKDKIHMDFYNYLNFENIIYIDSPSILEFQYKLSPHDYRNMEIIDDNIPYHLQSLNRKLKNSNNDIYDDEYYKKVDKFKKNVDKLIGGNFRYDKSNKRFILEKNGEIYQMENTASGLKQLGIIQLLLENRELTEHSFLILDEPEINLHPEFQIKLAEILVLAAKDLNINMYINTHSPFLAEAIEVYSKYYHLYNQTNFYLTESIDESNKCNYNKIEEFEIMEVYKNLGNPFDKLNEIRFKTEIGSD